MSEIVIGIDPDSKKYGVAVWVDGVLDDLQVKSIVDFSSYVRDMHDVLKHDNKILFAIEDVKTNSFMYARNQSNNPGIAAKMAQNVGMCKHAQTVAEEFIKAYGFDLAHVKPQKGNWAKDNKMFERITGWQGRSNEDTRSAAYIGFLHVKKTRVWHELQGAG